MRNGWHGVYPAITTKLDRREDVDFAAVGPTSISSSTAGVNAIVCCGSLGEASTLTADEKIDILKAAKERRAAARR